MGDFNHRLVVFAFAGDQQTRIGERLGDNFQVTLQQRLRSAAAGGYFLFIDFNQVGKQFRQYAIKINFQAL